MASWAKLVAKTSKIVTDNSPLILTGVGVAGTITTAVLAGRASYKAAYIIADSGEVEQTTQEQLKENVRLVWKLYIPAVSVGVLTITSIVFANQIGTRRAMAVATAYSLSERAFEDYRKKVVEVMGENKERSVRDQVAQDQVNENPNRGMVVVADDTNVLCYEQYTGRYFSSSMEKLRKAENDLNHKILHEDSASLSDFYCLVGLPRTEISDDLGWNANKLLELQFSAVLSEDQAPCLSIYFDVAPGRNYWRLY